MDEPGGEALVAEIRRRAQAEREALLADAASRAQAAGAAAEAAIRSLEAEARQSMGRLAAVDRRRILGRQEAEEGVRSLAARRSCMAEAFAGAAKQLEGLAGTDRMRRALGALVLEAMEAVGGKGELLVAPEDQELCRELARGRGYTFRIRPEGRAGRGVVAVSADGKRRIDNGLPGRLARAAVLLEPEVARRLFGDA